MGGWRVVGVLMMSMMGTGHAQDTAAIKLRRPKRQAACP